MARQIDIIFDITANRRCLLPILGCVLVAGILVLQIVAPEEWLGVYNLLLHCGIQISVLGLLRARVL
jgi:hypothetical protein